MTPEIEYFQDAAGEWRWHVKAANGEIVAQGEGHGSRADAERAAGEALAVFEQAGDEQEPA